jgi:hypothetical protein
VLGRSPTNPRSISGSAHGRASSLAHDTGRRRRPHSPTAPAAPHPLVTRLPAAPAHSLACRRLWSYWLNTGRTKTSSDSFNCEIARPPAAFPYRAVRQQQFRCSAHPPPHACQFWLQFGTPKPPPRLAGAQPSPDAGWAGLGSISTWQKAKAKPLDAGCPGLVDLVCFYPLPACSFRVKSPPASLPVLFRSDVVPLQLPVCTAHPVLWPGLKLTKRSAAFSP